METFPEHKVPPLLPEMINQSRLLEHDADNQEAYLYHGTNCYRRWEIKRSGQITPGRSGLSFYCSNQEEAFTYARGACLRDIRAGSINSLSCEPVVLKIRFDERAWIQVDFIQETLSTNGSPALAIAVLGPVPAANVIAVLNCSHGKRFAQPVESSIRSFADGSLAKGLARLREKNSQFRLDACMLKHLEHCRSFFAAFVSGKPAICLSNVDKLYRLAQLEARAGGSRRLSS